MEANSCQKMSGISKVLNCYLNEKLNEVKPRLGHRFFLRGLKRKWGRRMEACRTWDLHAVLKEEGNKERLLCT
jgi:hypothetical protein